MLPLPELPVMQVIIKICLLGIGQHFLFGVLALLLIPHIGLDVVLIVILGFGLGAGQGVGAQLPNSKQRVLEFLAVTLGLGVV